MTEERVIIILENDEQYEKFAGVIKLNGAYYYEPAPPKDWRPYCYYQDLELDSTGNCPGRHLGKSSKNPRCTKYPYRNLEQKRMEE